MKRVWPIWLGFLGVFIAGAVAGGFVSLRIASKAAEQQSQDDLSLRIMQRFSDRLDLTDAQRKAIEPHVDRAAAEMHRMRAQTADAMEHLEEIVARELTPPQRELLAVMQEELRENRRKWLEKREQEQKREAERRRSGNGVSNGDKPHSSKPPAP